MPFLINPFWATPSFGPASFGGLSGWWKADSFSLSDGTAIGGTGVEWIDQSGNGNDLVQSTALLRPTYRTNQFGSMPAIELPGIQYLLPSSSINLSGDFCALVVCKQTLSDDGILAGHDTLNRQMRLNRSLGNVCSYYAGGSELISSGYGTQDDLKMYAFRRSGGTVSFRENKTARGTGADANAYLITQIFISSGAGGTNALAGLVGELVIYTAHLSDSDIDNLYDNYLASRWGLP